MARKPNTPVGSMMDQARALLAANPVMAPQMMQFWKAQDCMLREAEGFSKAWFARRNAATKSAIAALGKLDGTGVDPAKSMQLALDWQQHSFQRLAEDMQEWMAMCARCTGHIADAEIEAGKEGTDHLVKQVASASGTKHATPV